MKGEIIYFACITLLCMVGVNANLKVEVTKEVVQCSRKTQNEDTLRIHYTGTFPNGKEFDSSLKRGHPFEFKIGVGNVIKGWDQGLLGMCEGEKRRLTIPPELAYGDTGFSNLIPPGSTIIFDTELLKIVEHDEL